ncbi:MAG: hypothetical protein JWM86_356 [Thermoleophilia bacterium]|nr:hypothetical protein [Thermoleophilia bacterium]
MSRRTFPPDLDRLARDRAAHQGGFIRDDQLVELGATPGYIRSRRELGLFVRRRPHVFLIGAPPSAVADQAWEPVLSVGRDAAVTGALALSLDGIHVRGVAPKVRVITGTHVPPSTSRDIIQSTTFAGEPIRYAASGLPTTTIERAILELGTETRNKWHVVNACHEAAFKGQLDLALLHERIEVSSRRHGLVAVREGVELYEAGGAVTASDAERRFLELLIAMGVPRAKLNQWVRVHGVSFRVDALWSSIKACIEVDAPPHLRPPNRIDDQTRDRLLDHLGYVRLRIDAADLTLRRQALVTAIWDFLYAAAARAGVDLMSLERF